MGEAFNILFCGHMAACVEMDMPLEEGMQLLLYILKEERNQALLKKLQKRFKKTKSLYKSMQGMKEFSTYMVEMIGIGEEMGRLGLILRNLEKYFTKEQELSTRLKVAFYYPIILGSVMLGILILLLVKVLPLFKEIFLSVDAPLSEVIGKMSLYGELLGVCAMVVLTLFMICGIVGFILLSTERGRRIGEEILQGTKIGQTLNQFKVLNVVEILLTEGKTLQDTLEASLRIIKEGKMEAQIKKVVELLREGSSIEEGINELKLFSNLQCYEIALANQLGRLDTVIVHIIRRQESELISRIQKKLEILEPLFVGIITIIIVLLLFAIMLPLLGMIRVL